jgi:hypothetical protein
MAKAKTRPECRERIGKLLVTPRYAVVLPIRPATPADIEAVARLHRAVRTACLPYLPELHTPEEDFRFFRERFFPTCTVWVGGGTRLAGYCAFRDG